LREASSPVATVSFFGFCATSKEFAERKEGTNLVLLENTPFLTSFELTTLAVVAPLNGVAHGRHAGWL
jgi:hypothetical protein